jgi:hypothetical protein
VAAGGAGASRPARPGGSADECWRRWRGRGGGRASRSWRAASVDARSAGPWDGAAGVDVRGYRRGGDAASVDSSSESEKVRTAAAEAAEGTRRADWLRVRLLGPEGPAEAGGEGLPEDSPSGVKNSESERLPWSILVRAQRICEYGKVS